MGKRNFYEIVDSENGKRCCFKIQNHSQQGNKIIVFDIKVSFKMKNIKVIGKSQLS